jgi:hypothetical protein
MDFELLKKIERQIPSGTLIQFHNNGEPTLYPYLEETLNLFSGRIRCFDTNGKLLVEKLSEIDGNMESLTISVIEDDPVADEQLAILKEFNAKRTFKKPMIVLRFLGEVDETKYKDIEAIKVNRILHSPMGSFGYTKRTVIPETGICEEMLHHPAIDRHGNLSICVRFDYKGLGVLGNLNNKSLDELWNGETRMRWLNKHIAGQRKCVPLCMNCDFWGIPRG